MFSEKNYWRFTLSALLLFHCLGFETATAHTKGKIQNPLQSTQTQSTQNLMHLLAPDAQEYLSTQNQLKPESEELKHTKPKRRNFHTKPRVRRKKIRRYRVQYRYCPVNYHQRLHNNRVRGYRHGVEQKEIIHRGHPRDR